MPRPTHSRSDIRGVGLRGPFDLYPSEDDEIQRLDGFLQRTGLGDYERDFRIGAFLARRNPGADQLDFIRKFRSEERKATSNSRPKGTVPQYLQYGPTEAIEIKEMREAQEDRILLREGHKEKWFRLHVLFRQNWHVIALVGCCSLGAMIQGWDETAINGGWFDIV